jgi:NADH dehydrogenase FAD-containing subunit
MADETVLVLGGGVGGLVVSNSLKKELGRRAKIRLIASLVLE